MSYHVDIESFCWTPWLLLIENLRVDHVLYVIIKFTNLMDVSQSDEIGDYKTHVYGTLVSITDIILLIPIHLIIIVELKQLIVLQSNGIWQ